MILGKTYQILRNKHAVHLEYAQAPSVLLQARTGSIPITLASRSLPGGLEASGTCAYNRAGLSTAAYLCALVDAEIRFPDERYQGSDRSVAAIIDWRSQILCG